MDFMVQPLATDKKGCIFSGTIFRILLNLVSCYGFKEGVYFFLTVKRRKQLLHYNSVATLASSAASAALQKKKKTYGGFAFFNTDIKLIQAFY